MPAKPRPKFVLIDAHALIHRAFHAIPFLATKDGELTNAVYGFTATVLSVLKELKPEYIAVSFDLPEPTFRHKMYSDYKATRQKAPDELKSQFGRVREVVDALGMPVFEVPGYEADDVIGSLAKQYTAKHQLETYIVTGDKDSLQLVDEHIKIFTLRKGIKDTIIYDLKLLKDETGLTPDEFIEYKALKGDPSDNIPGVPGIGDKTAVILVQKFGTLEKLYKALADDPAKHPEIKPKVRSNLTEFEKQAYLSRDLSRIVTDIKLKFSLSACRAHDFNLEGALKLFKKLEFSSLARRLQEAMGEEGAAATPADTESAEPPKRDWGKKKYELIGTETAFKQFVTLLKKQKIFAFDTETERLDSLSPNIAGISFSWQANHGYYLPLKHKTGPTLPLQATLKTLKPIFEDASVGKVGHHLKYDTEVVGCYGIEVQGLHFDTLLGSYLLNPGARTLKLDRLAYQELGYEMQPIEELIGKGKKQISISEVDSETAGMYAAEDADLTWQLYEKFSQNLDDIGLTKVLMDIELPLVPVLARMERRGIKLDPAFLKKMSKQFVIRLEKLEKAVHKLAGRDFNLNSPAQLSTVLFDEMKIGKGTDRARRHHVDRCRQPENFGTEHIQSSRQAPTYRELATTPDDLRRWPAELVRWATGRLHTSYRQTAAATGY